MAGAIGSIVLMLVPVITKIDCTAISLSAEARCVVSSRRFSVLHPFVFWTAWNVMCMVSFTVQAHGSAGICLFSSRNVNVLEL